MREGKIDLDWLDGNIEAHKKVLDEKKDSYTELDRTYNHLLNAFLEVRSKCKPIEQLFEFADSGIMKVVGNASAGLSGLLYGNTKEPVFLSKTCINNWESNAYCDKCGYSVQRDIGAAINIRDYRDKITRV